MSTPRRQQQKHGVQRILASPSHLDRRMRFAMLSAVLLLLQVSLMPVSVLSQSSATSGSSSITQEDIDAATAKVSTAASSAASAASSTAETVKEKVAEGMKVSEEYMKETAEAVKTAAKDAAASAGVTAEEVKSAAEDAAATARATAEEMKSAVKDAAATAGDIAEEMKSAAKDAAAKVGVAAEEAKSAAKDSASAAGVTPEQVTEAMKSTLSDVKAKVENKVAESGGDGERLKPDKVLYDSREAAEPEVEDAVPESKTEEVKEEPPKEDPEKEKEATKEEETKATESEKVEEESSGTTASVTETADEGESEVVETNELKMPAWLESIANRAKPIREMTKQDVKKVAAACLGVWGVSVGVGWLAQAARGGEGIVNPNSAEKAKP